MLPSLLSGGIEKHTIKLLNHFDRDTSSFSLITLFDYPGRPDLYSEVPEDVSVHRLAFRGPFDFIRWSELYSILKKRKSDIVVSSMFSANTIVRLLKPFLHYKVVTREHNIYSEKNLVQRFVDMSLAPFSDTIIAVASSVGDFFSKQAWIRRDRITVIHNGVDIEAIERFVRERGADEVARVRAELGLQNDEKIILNVARLKPQKDHRVLIEAFALFSHTHSDYHLVIIGDGIERKRLEEYVKERDLEHTVHLMGYRNDAFAFYAASDFFVLTSKYEGFPNVGVEAMAFGLPMISTRVSGVDEFLEDGRNGYGVSSDPEDIASKMVIIASMSENEKKSVEICCKETGFRFDIRKIAQKYENVFLRITS